MEHTNAATNHTSVPNGFCRCNGRGWTPIGRRECRVKVVHFLLAFVVAVGWRAKKFTTDNGMGHLAITCIFIAMVCFLFCAWKIGTEHLTFVKVSLDE